MTLFRERVKSKGNLCVWWGRGNQSEGKGNGMTNKDPGSILMEKLMRSLDTKFW